MVSFYRLAQEGDFSKYESECVIPYTVRDILIESGDTMKACKEYRQLCGASLFDAKKVVAEYKSYLQAKDDYYKGRPIYTEY